MIQPTIGRVVWFYTYVPGQGHKGPLAAHVCKVWSDAMVNLMVIDGDGNPMPRTSVSLVQADGEVPAGNYCRWMPYQVGQAANQQAMAEKITKGI